MAWNSNTIYTETFCGHMKLADHVVELKNHKADAGEGRVFLFVCVCRMINASNGNHRQLGAGQGCTKFGRIAYMYRFRLIISYKND